MPYTKEEMRQTLIDMVAPAQLRDAYVYMAATRSREGFVGIDWVLGTACGEQTSSVFDKTLNTYIRKHAKQFWNTEHLG